MGEPHVVSALKDKRAEMAGIIADLEQRMAQHQASLRHIDIVLRLFAPDIVPEEIRPKRPRASRTGWFKVGECFRLVMDLLREAPAPLTTRQIVEHLMRVKGLDPADARTRDLIQKTALGTLNRARGLVEPVTVVAGGGKAWRIVA